MIERREDASDVAAGRALIRDEAGLVPDRSNPDHLFHRSLATRAGYSPASWQLRHDTTHSNTFTMDKRTPVSLVASSRSLYGRKLSATKMPARGRGRPVRRAGQSPHAYPALLGRPAVRRGNRPFDGPRV